MKTANERLAEARGALGFDRKAEFAEHVGIERSTYDKMEKGPHKPSADNLERIVLRCPNLNLTWLLTGKGQMLLDGPVIASPGVAPTEGLTSGPATVAEAENVLLRDAVLVLKAENGRLWELLGKSPGSPDAARPLPKPIPRVGRKACATT